MVESWGQVVSGLPPSAGRWVLGDGVVQGLTQGER
jgi:hypothetical protein